MENVVHGVLYVVIENDLFHAGGLYGRGGVFLQKELCVNVDDLQESVNLLIGRLLFSGVSSGDNGGRMGGLKTIFEKLKQFLEVLTHGFLSVGLLVGIFDQMLQETLVNLA